jgi:hypothetical protein
VACTRKEATCQSISDAQCQNARVPLDAITFQPQASGTASQQVEVTENDRPRILAVDESREEDVDGSTDWIEGKVASVLDEGEDGKGEREGERGEGRLVSRWVRFPRGGYGTLTVSAMPGTNMRTASA